MKTVIWSLLHGDMQLRVMARAKSNELCRRHESNDLPLGHPFNIAQYGLLVHMIAQCCNMEADELIWAGADVHTYENQIDAAEEQLSRLPFVNTQPRVVLTPGIRSIDAFSFDDIKIEDYDEHWGVLRYPVAV